MTREEAIARFKGIKDSMSISVAQSKFYKSKAELNELCDMAISALTEAENGCDGCLYEVSDGSLFHCNICRLNYGCMYEKDDSNNITESPNDAIETDDEAIEQNALMSHEEAWAEIESDLISRADAINALSKDIMGGLNYNRILKELPSAVADGEDLIIKGAKGIKDGLYNIKDGELFKYKSKGGTVRTYPIVPSDDRPSGKWIHEETGWYGGDGYKCSACGYGYSAKAYHEPYEFTYCPNCGAKMGERENVGTDCTDFIHWISKVVADEELWELNAVGYGEIICRKLVKVGALATTEKPPYYYVPSVSAERVGEWIPLIHETEMTTNFPWERDGQWVIVTDGKTISVERIKKDAYDHFFPGGRWFELEHTTAWMPLPQPYGAKMKGGNDGSNY